MGSGRTLECSSGEPLCPTVITAVGTLPTLPRAIELFRGSHYSDLFLGLCASSAFKTMIVSSKAALHSQMILFISDMNNLSGYVSSIRGYLQVAVTFLL